MLTVISAAGVSVVFAFLVMFGVTVVANPAAASWRGFASVSTVVCGAVSFGTLFTAVFSFARRGATVSRRTLRESNEINDGPVIEIIQSLGLAAGVGTPTARVVRGDVVNTTVFGRASSVCVILTDGAQSLPADRLAALVAFDLAIVRSPALLRAQSARLSVEIVSGAIKTLWVMLVLGLALVAVTNHAAPWGALSLIAVAGYVVLIPVGAIVSTAAVTLAIATNMIADRDAVGMTFRPDVYLEVLEDVLSDDSLTSSNITPLAWFERATMRNDLPALIGNAASQIELGRRIENMAAIAAMPLPAQMAEHTPRTNSDRRATQHPTDSGTQTPVGKPYPSPPVPHSTSTQNARAEQPTITANPRAPNGASARPIPVVGDSSTVRQEGAQRARRSQQGRRRWLTACPLPTPWHGAGL